MRVSLKPSTLAYLQAEQAHFHTDDINELIQGIAIERRQLLQQQAQGSSPVTLTPGTSEGPVAPSALPQRNWSELSALLED
ncbi:MAG TPA: hypothetical protein V6D06_18790 [Trichocoleus sp.]